MNAKGPSAASERKSIGKIGPRRRVVIPKAIFDDLGMREGDFVEFERTRDRLVIRRKGLGDSEDTLTPTEAKTVRKGEQQLRRGQSRSWDDVKRDLDI